MKPTAQHLPLEVRGVGWGGDLFLAYFSHIPAHRETFPRRFVNLSYSLGETDASEHLLDFLEATFRNQAIMPVHNLGPTRTVGVNIK